MMGLAMHVSFMRFDILGTGYGINGTLLAWTVISLPYFKADPLIGTITYAFGVALFSIATRNFYPEDMFYTCLGIHLFGWVT